MTKNEDVLAFTKWWPHYYKKKVISEDEKQSFNVSEFRQFDYTLECIGAVKAHPFIDSPVFHTFKLAKDASVPILPTEKAYPSGKIPINNKKIEDLKKIEKYLPPEEDIMLLYNFYQEIFLWPTSENDDEEGLVDS
ncbi:hypothetical protein ABMA28_017317 [Loxostege sticticalis]|uniref:Uncharacterized protein n=1 Tax=Loxostege sticticalis TaxID=481309 RepID=A0ABD0S1U5_LOXSC